MKRVGACAKPFCGFARIGGRVLCVHRSVSFHTRVRGSRSTTHPAPTLREWRFSHTNHLSETTAGCRSRLLRNQSQLILTSLRGVVQRHAVPKGLKVAH